jgi:hypothetical protein
VLVYIEYISRRPGISPREFYFGIGRGQTGWAADYAEDQLLLNVGRTFRTGPEPEYVCVWYTPGAGLERIGEWGRIFKSGVVDDFEETFKLVARIDKAGCYEPLLEPVAGSQGPYYGEYFDFGGDASTDDVRSFFEERRARHPELELNLLVDRIGKLGPDPRGLAIWRAPGFGALEQIARELDGVDSPIRLVHAALYENTGEETL